MKQLLLVLLLVASSQVVLAGEDASSNLALDLEFWERIKDQKNANMFQAYIDQFPEGVYVALAKFELKVLGSDTSTVAKASDKKSTASIDAGLGVWGSKLSGQLGSSSTDVGTLGFDDGNDWWNSLPTEPYFYLTLNHAVPYLPQVRLEKSGTSATGTGTLTASHTIGDHTFTASTSVESSLDLSLIDVVLYYKKPYEKSAIDYGIVLRSFDAEASVASALVSKSESADGVLPMGYLGANIDLPSSRGNVSLSADIKYIAYDKNSLSDYRAGVTYGFSLLNQAIELEAGYRNQVIDLGDEDDDFTADIAISGGYLGLMIKKSF